MLKNDSRVKKGNSSTNPLITQSQAQTLKNVRIIQKHLVYVIGLSYQLANKETLSKYDYFGQYGTIQKTVVNKNKAYNPEGPNGPSYSAYISYSSAQEASIAILSVDNIEIDSHTLRASFGTTKYCTFFLKNFDCPNKDCLYLHHMAEEDEIIYRDDMSSNKSIFHEQQLLAIRLADLYNSENKKRLLSGKKSKCGFPSVDLLYNKEIVIENSPEQSIKYSNSSGYSRFKKKYEYEEYYPDYYQNEEEVEYVLVRNKKDKFHNKNKTSLNLHNTIMNTSYKCKSDDDSEKKTSPNSDNKDELEEKSAKTEKICENIKVNAIPTYKNIFRKRDNSRFEFVTKKNEENQIDVQPIFNSHDISKNNTTYTRSSTFDDHEMPTVPEFISDMIYKKISRFTFFKKFTCVKDKSNDILFFEKELHNNNNSWAKFIKSNLDD